MLLSLLTCPTVRRVRRVRRKERRLDRRVDNDGDAPVLLVVQNRSHRTERADRNLGRDCPKQAGQKKYQDPTESHSVEDARPDREWKGPDCSRAVKSPVEEGEGDEVGGGPAKW